jgi:hypothetical protein
LFFRQKSVWSALQLFGAVCLMIVVFAHAAEVFRLFPSMNWGFPNSVGHYVDFGSAVLGLALFPLGYFFDALGVHQRAPTH